MADITTVRIVILFLGLRFAAAVFFHEPSSISIYPASPQMNSNFGFSMGYMNKTIVIGAPIEGHVYICGVGNARDIKEIACTAFSIKIQKGSYFGGSIATTSDQCLACAPLWKSPKPELLGRCIFWKNNHTDIALVTDLYDLYLDLKRNGGLKSFKMAHIVGGKGWSTLIDEDNDKFLIMKTSLQGDIVYGSLIHDDTNSQGSLPVIKTTSTVKTNDEMGSTLPKYYNFGFGHTAGKFFSNKTVYALSMETPEDMRSIVEFFDYDKYSDTLHSINAGIYSGGFATIQSETVGMKFGSVLAAADMNKDGYSELLVGEPLHTEEQCVDCGALFIYLGGDRLKMNTRNWLWIMGVKEFGRFGSAIAAKDIDGDELPELAVSAPYEDKGLGAVYIISGYEIYMKLNSKKEDLPIQLSEFKYIQKIQQKAFRTLGFSLQFIPDTDDNGCSELVIGSPGSAKAVLLKAFQAITVKLNIALIGEQIVREQDPNCTINVCAIVDYPKLSHNVVADLVVQSSIIGGRAEIPSPLLSFDLSCNNCNRRTFCKEVIVKLNDIEPADYSFSSKAKLLTDHIFNSTVFNTSWAVESPYSEMFKSIEVHRHCKGDDCLPKLSMLPISWSHSNNEYVLDSSATETVSIVVSNEGNSSYGACVFVTVYGTQLSQLSGCLPYNDGYKCFSPNPLRRDSKHTINLLLIMEPTTKYEKLRIEADLLENCNNESVIKDHQKFIIPYTFTTYGIDVNGTDIKKDVPDKQIDDDNDFITEDQEYLITNNGNITWNKVQVKLSVKKTGFVNNFKVMNTIVCTTAHTAEEFIHSCALDLMPNNKHKVIATTYILKKEIQKHLSNKKLTVTSQLELHLRPTNEILNQSITSVLRINKEISVGENKWLIGLIAGCVSLLVLILIVLILYKIGFFKRKQKQRLHVLRESIKQRNSRRNTHVSSAADNQSVAELQMNEEDIDEEDDNVFDKIPESQRTKDNVLVESKADVHNRL